MNPRHLAAAAVFAVGTAVPALAQESVVTQSLPTPDVGALQAPDSRQGETLDRDGATIFYEAAGSGPPMLLLHGFPLSGALFARLRDALEDDFTVITVDHRGYGQSEGGGANGDLSTYAGDALAVMDALSLDDAIIGGMSMGGPIVFEMYRQAPDRFSGLVLIDTIASAASPIEKGVWEGVPATLDSGGREAVMQFLMPNMLTGETRMNSPEVVDYLQRVMMTSSEEAFRAGAEALASRPDSTSLLSEIDVPTLIVVGQEDPVYPVAIARQMQSAIGDNAAVAIIPGASHAAVFEEPGLVAAAITEWADTSQ